MLIRSALSRGRRVGESPKIQTPLRHGRRRRVVGFRRGEQIFQLAAQLPHLLARRLWGRRPRRRRGRCLLASGHRFGVWIARVYRFERAERLPCVIVTACARGLSEMPCSNECPSALALELCEPAEEVSLRLLAEFRVRAQKTRAVLRDLKLSGPITRPHRCHLLRKTASGAMLPVRDFRRRRRRPFAALGQPLIFFWLAALLAHAAAQPHAREHHAQHIMNQARAHQKACGCSVSSQSRRARSAERPGAVHNVASMACGVGQRRRMASRRRARGPRTNVTHAGAPNNKGNGSAASTKKEKKRPGPTT